MHQINILSMKFMNFCHRRRRRWSNFILFFSVGSVYKLIYILPPTINVHNLEKSSAQRVTIKIKSPTIYNKIMGKCDLQWNMNAIVSLFASSHRATKNRSLLFVQLVVGMCVCVWVLLHITPVDLVQFQCFGQFVDD